MGTPETSREPCPDRILDDLGGAFGTGAIGGSIFYFIKGSINSPKGERLLGGFQTMKMSAPRTGGGFAAWGGLYSTLDCALVYVRQKEDPWNSIIAGATAGGCLSLRQGFRTSAKSAVLGGALLALVEGAGIMLNRLTPPPQTVYEDPNMAALDGPGGAPNAGFWFPSQGPSNIGGGGYEELMNQNSGSGSRSRSGSGFFGGWFGGGGGEKKEGSGSGSGGGSEAKVLESFDTPMPNFDYKLSGLTRPRCAFFLC